MSTSAYWATLLTRRRRVARVDTAVFARYSITCRILSIVRNVQRLVNDRIEQDFALAIPWTGHKFDLGFADRLLQHTPNIRPMQADRPPSAYSGGGFAGPAISLWIKGGVGGVCCRGAAISFGKIEGLPDFDAIEQCLGSPVLGGETETSSFFGPLMLDRWCVDIGF
jgi:hypothetical protein